MLPRLLLLTVSASLACGPIADDSEGADGIATTGAPATSGAQGDDTGSTFDDEGGDDLDFGDGIGPDPDPDPDPACACAEPGLDGFEPGCNYDALWDYGPACDLPALCETLQVTCAREGADLYSCQPSEIVFDEPALTCALEALRDGTPGRLNIDGTLDLGIFAGQQIHVLRILDDGRITTNACLSTDVGAQWNPTVARVRAGADHFAMCLAAPELADRYACLFDGLLAGAEPLPACG
jgi:hypothetical protein